MKIKKLKIEPGRPRGVCDFCLEKGKTHRLVSAYRNYRSLNICPKCLKKLRSGFK